jgi:hypothetical protein
MTQPLRSAEEQVKQWLAEAVRKAQEPNPKEQILRRREARKKTEQKKYGF